MLPGPYFRHPAIHWCFVHGFCIVLDVERDRYLSIPSHHIQPLLPYIHEAGEMPSAPPSRAVPQELLPAAAELLAAGVLTTTCQPRSRMTSPPLPKPCRHLPQYPVLPKPSRLGAVLLPFVRACALADFQLRHVSFKKIVARVAARRRGAGALAAASTEDTACLTSAFITLRPLYPRRYRCMFDSLALLEFLWCWNILPRWVFGVSADPFEAHCWIQDDDLVLCDTRDFAAARFAPIMAI